MTPLLTTKTQIPQTNGNLLGRPRLLNLLDNCLAVPLTILAAPAGFGKTTLLCQWIAARRDRKAPPMRAAWLSLDEQDGDLNLFLGYFVAALRTVYPNACQETEKLLSVSQIRSDRALITVFINELDDLGKEKEQAGHEHLVLVLDDYDLVNNDAINTLIAAIMRHPLRRLHLVLACRYDPVLPLARWRSENRLLEIRSLDLRLNRPEIEQFLRQAVPINWTPAQIAALDEKTEGWTAGLHLITLTVQDAAGADRIAKSLNAPHQHVMNYLTEEVLRRLSPQVQSNLIQISILDRFNAELCQAICDEMRGSGDEFISELRRANQFLIGLDEEGTWFRFHRLFQELLRYQLRLRYDGAARAVLHKRAMDWHAQNGLIEQALAHAFAARDIAGAAELVARHRHALMNREEWQRLAGWLALFSNDEIAQFPDLLLAKAWIARVLNFDLEVTRVLTQQALNLLDAPKTPTADSAGLWAEVNVLHAMQIYRAEANAVRVIKLTSHSLDVLPQDWSMVRMHAYTFLAGGYQLQGDLARAIEVLHQGQTEEVLSEYSGRARALRSEALMYWMAGNLPAMLESGRRPYRSDPDSDFSETGIWSKYFIAAASYERNDLATAEEHAAAALKDSNPWGTFRPIVDCALILALVYQARNMPERAREVLDDTLGWALEKHSDNLVQTIRAFQAGLAVRQGDMVTANRWHASFGNPTPSGAMPNFSSPFITSVRVLIAQNTPESRRQAGESLKRLKAHLSATHNVRFLIDVLALEALLLERKGDQPRALKALAQAAALAEPGGFIRLFVDLGEPMEKLVSMLARDMNQSPYLKAMLNAFNKTLAAPKPLPSSSLVESLSDRELVVLELLAKRLTNKEIAHELIISPLTVKSHTEHIYQKLGVNSRQDAVKVAVSLGMVVAPR